ncbi:pyridoxal phosphate-dependent aminotransferase [Paenibacillus sp. TH7-28]
MNLSYRAKSFTESVIREMTRVCDEMNGINLSQGFPDFAAPQEIKEAAVKAIKEDINQYSVTFGSPALRQAIARKALEFNNILADPETEITVTCGATEAMISTMNALINPGDEVVIFEPFYENYGPDTILSGAEPKFVSLYPPAWNYDYEELKAAFSDKTKAIIINTPNNPTGKVFSRTELEEIADLCIKHDAIAVCDEIYEHIVYDNNRHTSMATLDEMKDRTVTINSISKTYSLTGWRIGWAIANSEITQSIRTVHDFLTVGAPSPLQEAAAHALTLDDSYYDQLQSRYTQARSFMYDTLVNNWFKPYPCQGAYYFLTDANDWMREMNIKNDTEFSLQLIKLTGVATVPGTSFYSDKTKESGFVRFCFCKSEQTLIAAAEALGTLKAHIY